ncbi:arginine deiminase family protein [Persicobacter psychrovividus]|uniref:arginine deiminase n=1 Tax=Persicobacter psychrovividus TaxID=387638 RepID=A0ABM7VB45_9BACT|nr:arginine deiminase [Persicobacter psychrovividus]
MELKLQSEFGVLNGVIMHRPGFELEMLTPDNIKEFLFEDVPYLEQIQREHDEFRALVRLNTNAKVFRLEGLLQDVMKDEKLRLNAYKSALAVKGYAHVAEDLLAHLSLAEATTALTSGIRMKHLRRKWRPDALADLGDLDFLITPSPNSYFMRDPAAVIQSGVISSHMKYPGRQRESDIMQMIFAHHPQFKNNYVNAYEHDGSPETPCIEGGDVIVLSEKALAIGNSERTDPKAIKQVAKHALANSNVERVYEVHLPARRNFMHLDTVFTMIDENLIVTYPDAMEMNLTTYIYRQKGVDSNGEVILEEEVVNKSIIDLLKQEIPHLEVIGTAQGYPEYASREQWYDGANVFAIGPRRVITYDRNKYTNRALKEAGVEVLEIKSSELSRGLGGPRCMTMPLERQPLR